MITVKRLSDQEIQDLGIKSWPVWEKEASEFPWEYDTKECCYILEGKVVVTPDGGEPVAIQSGDYVEFAAGLKCCWDITENIRKHYQFQ